MDATAKLVGAPQATPQLKSLVLREVLIKTPGYVPTGDTYEHPARAQLHFDNPITTVYHSQSGNSRLYFGSKNGEVGVIQQTSYKFVPVHVNPPHTTITKININYYSNHIGGFKFYSKDNVCVLEAGE